MEETPRAALRDVDPSTLWVAYGYDREVQARRGRGGHERDRDAGPEGYAYIFPKRDHVNVGIGYVLSHYRERDRRGAVRAAARLRRRSCATAAWSTASRCARTSRRSSFRSAGRCAKPGRGRVLLAGDAGGFVNGVHRRRHLLRDGVRRARGARDPRDPRTRVGIWLARVSARVRSRNRRRAARFGADSAISVRGSPQDCARIIEARIVNPRLTRLILDFAIGRRSYRDCGAACSRARRGSRAGSSGSVRDKRRCRASPTRH